ncbi:calcium-translocating P-type ATPase, PMCA-type [Methylovulum psychrotolerans]|uniref:P-type Ca(2+) transporter n=1 Tax=Methylovulum psychrotolerans TaxID=1704499 RepID=A0A1Z4C1Z8_9GAMM|nr:calcium-translocating P-type ATPase, PMCA-type [Methylovulum psychrotolerans]ASF47553.1 calcium-translocating P-type ATPase, PMCA-type [Methylovulum psychrotolerans]
MDRFLAKAPLQAFMPLLLLIGLILLAAWVLSGFFTSIIWAVIIAYITWPLYRRLRQRLNDNADLSAGLMTAAITGLIALIIFWLVAMLHNEVTMAYQSLAANFSQQPYQLPPAIRHNPWLGDYLQPWMDRLNRDRSGTVVQVLNAARQGLGQLAQWLGGVGESLLNLGLVLVTVFFCFRDGNTVLQQVRLGLKGFLGASQALYWQTAGDTTRAVVYGLVLAALGQGLTAGIGYAVAGVEAPVLLGVVTAILAMVPMGAMLVWGAIDLSLFLSDQWLAGLGLLLWGTLVVSTIDNVIRPLVISGAGKVPFLVVMFGVFGGLSSFGLVGLFLGPVVLSVLLAVWQAWLATQTDTVTAPPETAEPPNTAWHHLSAEAVLKAQVTDALTGLSTPQAEQRLHQHGANQLATKPPRPAWRLLLAQFKSILILVLIAAAALAALIGDLMDGAVIMGVVMVNALLGFYQEFQAEQALAALKKMLTLHATVRRNGNVAELPAEQLVPGDIVLLEAGNKIPADGRILLAYSLEADESSLTGESLPAAKQTQALSDAAAPLAERSTMLYMNNTITRGRAEMVVTATGMATEIGQLAELLTCTDEAETPLQRQLGSVGKRLALLALAVVAIVFAAALWRGEPLAEAAFTAIALAVAAIPEGLPAVVTVTLALGMHRMAQQHAIVKRLAAVETLGCTTVICTDKTGTLTVNQLTARAVYYRGQSYQVSGEGYQAAGAIVPDTANAATDLNDLLLPLVLCNDSDWHGAEVIGDPLEGALLVLAAKGGMNKQQALAQLPRIAEIPFDAEHKFMATFHRSADGIRVFVKGAPEVLLARCTFAQNAQGESVALPHEALLAHNAALASTGLRVLAVAVGQLPDGPLPDTIPALADLLQALTFTALIGLIDPPRPEARQAIALCQQAGIAVKMITGDQVLTASVIAQELGLPGTVLEGTQLAALSAEALAAAIDGIGVFARTTPAQKVQIVNALKKAGHIVAMTGDGVNDAPALKSADIGIAMGVSGTHVAQEAATMILTDDNFASIVNAVKEGRGIYDNMVKFIRFQLSTNIGAILTVLSAPLLGMPLPFTAVQLLWINIIMDGPPAMSLGVDPLSAHSMERPPRASAAPILSWPRLGNLLCYGLTMAIGTLGILYYGLQTGTAAHATTLAFHTFVLFQVFNVFNARTEHGTAFNRHFFANRWFWLAISTVLALQILIIHWPPAQTVFHTTALTGGDWLLATGIAGAVLVLEELRKGLCGRMIKIAGN